MNLKQVYIVLFFFVTTTYLFGQGYLDCIPDVLDIQVDGQLVDFGSSIDVELNTLDETFQIRLRGKNIGTDNNPAPYNNLTMSFVQFNSSSDKDRISFTTYTSSDLDESLYFGSEAGGGDQYADYVMYEAVDNDSWQAGELNAVFINVKPKNWGEFVIKFRMGLGTDESYSNFNYDPSGGYIGDDDPNGAGDCLGFESYEITVNIIQAPQYGDLTVEVKNIDGTSTPYPGDNGRVQLYNSETLVASDNTDANGNAYFSNIEEGSGYYYKVYHTPDDPNNIFGEEYWGKEENVTIYGNTTNYSEFTRNMPYGQDIKVYKNGEDVTGQSVTAGTELEFRITVTNPNVNNYYARTRLVLDRNKSESYDYDNTSSGQIVYGNNGEKTFIFYVTLNDEGDYYRALSTQTDVDGGYRNTDGWGWIEQPIITIENQYGDLTVEVKNIDGTSTPYPADNGRVQLYNSEGVLIATDNTDANGNAYFSNLDAGSGYYYKVYHTPDDPNNIFGEEYWGKKENVTIYGNTTNYSEFTRNMPYGQDIKVYKNGEDVTGQSVTAGTELEFRITVTNPNVNNYYARTRLVLDRNKSESYDYDNTSSGQIVYGNNGEKTFIFYVTLNDEGDYYRALSTQTDVDGGYRNTDGWGWSEQPIIKIKLKKIIINIPKGGEKWAVGTKQDITWESEGVNTLLIEYSVDDGASWATIQNNVEASLGKYEWEEIPNTPSENCYIKLTDSENYNVYSKSNKFSIVELNVNENELITKEKNKLKYQGKYITYVGVNLYFMQDLIAQGKEYIIQDLLDICEQRGINVIRTWAFNDDPESPSVIQMDPDEELNEENFNALKRVVELAEQRGFKLIMPLVNHWTDYGGMQRYVIWYNEKFNAQLDTSKQKYEHHFYTNETIKNWYKSYITKIVTEFRESDAIMAWELANEPRESNWSAPAPTDTAEFKKWIEEMSSYIRESLDPNHLIGLGGEGNFSYNKEDEVYFKDIYNRKNIDFTSLHLYTEPEKLDLKNLDEMENYFSKRKELSNELDKPFLIEEFGFKREINGDEQIRIDYYNGIYQRFDNQGVNGSNFWQLLHNDLPENDWDKDTYGIYENRDSEILDAIEKAAKSRNDINIEITSINLVDYPPDGLQIIGYVEDKNQNRKPNYTIGAEDPVDLVSTSLWATTNENGDFNYISTNSAETNNYIYKFFSQEGEAVDKVLSVSVETTSDYGGNELIVDKWITVNDVIFDLGEAVDLNNDTKTFGDKVNSSSIPPDESLAHKSLEIAGNYLIKSIGNTLVDYASNPFNIVASIGALTCLVPEPMVTKATCPVSLKAVVSGIKISVAKSFAKTAIDMSDLTQEKKDKYNAIIDYGVAGISLAKMSKDFNIIESAQSLTDVNNVIYTNLYSVDHNSTNTITTRSSSSEEDDALYMVVIDSDDNYVLIEIRDNSELTAHLSDGVCNPSSGTINDEYTFTVLYIDPDNQPPDNPIELVIDDEAKYLMTPQGSNWSEGVEYIYVSNPGTFSEGDHTYYFQGSQGETKLREPLTGYYSFSVDDPNTLDIELTLEPNPTDINTQVTCTATTNPIKVNYPIDFDQDETLGEFEDSNPIYTNEDGVAVVIYHPKEIGTTSIFALDGNDHNNYDSKSLTINGQQNTSPTLTFTKESGYETDGVNPDQGIEGSTFEFRIKYTDVDGDEPKEGYPVVHIFDNGIEISSSPFIMSAVNSDPVADGRIYTYSISSLTASGNYTYRFEAQDANGAVAEGEGTDTMNGPEVTENSGNSDSLVAYWSFDDGTATDNSGNGNDGTIQGTPTTVEGVSGNALQFNGSDYIEIGNLSEELKKFPSREHSYSCWVYLDATINDTRYITDAANPDAEPPLNDQRGIRFESSQNIVSKWITYDGDVRTISKTELELNQWYHICAVNDGNAGKIYINAVEDTSETITSWGGEIVNFFIGATSGGSGGFVGRIDELKLFNKALSQSEINELANINNAPSLTYTGEVGYDSDGVNPDEGEEGSTFEFRIKYTDTDGDDPGEGYPVVHIFDNGAEISGSPFIMSAVNSDPVTDGRIYTYSTSSLTTSDNYTYQFEAQDVNGAVANGDGTNTMNGPVVIENSSNGDSLVAYWNFNDGNISTATDISGNGNTGTVYNATLTSGYDDALEQAFYFDSDNDTIIIYIQENLSSINQGDYTISMWIKFDEIPTNNRFALDMGDVDQFGFRFLGTTKPTYKWNLSSGNVTLTADTALQTGSWAHIVSVLEDNRGKIYVNGKKFVDSSVVTSHPSELISKFAIGNICGGGQAPTYFPGSIDEVKIFNKALSDAEVRKLFNGENIAPTLTFTGETGYETDGVNPDEGNEGSAFEFRIKYTDADGDEPSSGYPAIHIFNNGTEISGSPFAMSAVNSDPVTFGRIYTYSTSSLTASDNYTYRFDAQDANGAMAEGEGTNTLSGPVVTDSASAEPIGITMYKIDGGTFIMGNNNGPSDEQPEHEVTVSTFQLSKHEITNRQFVEVYNWALEQGKISVNSTTVENTAGEHQELLDLDAEGCYISYNGTQLVVEDGRDDQPVCEVTWYGAVAFSNYYSEKNGLTPVYDFNDWSCNWDGNGYRLPTEAEWEYAAGGGNQSHDYEYSGSNNVDEVGWYLDNSGSQPHVVGTKNPNELGLYDMSGNNQEWCWDYFGNYSSEPQTDPVGPSSQEDERRILRGGSWSSTADILRVTNREHISANLSNGDTGFRIAKKYLGEPTLTWTGEAGYESDGVNPDTLKENETVTFRVKYSDPDGDQPAEGYPKVYIFKNGNAINGSPFVMSQANSESFISGRIYLLTTDSLVEGNDYTYKFEAKDINEITAIGEATQEKQGPVVEKSIPAAPQLVSPENNSLNQELTLILDWNDVENAETYQLQVSDSSDFSHLIINQQGIDTSQYEVTDDILHYSTKYFWRTNAQNSSGTSSWSDEWNFTTKNAPELSVSPESWDAPPAGGTSSEFSVTNSGNDDSLKFTVTTSDNWLSVNITDSITPGSFTITAESNNTGTERTGNVEVKATSDDVINSPFIVTVTQNPIPDDIQWQSVLTVSDENGNKSELTFGTATNATDNYDDDYDQYAPPPPPSGSFDASFSLNNERYIKDFRAPLSSDDSVRIVWNVEFQYSNGGDPITLEWNNSAFNDEGYYTLVDDPDSPQEINIDMREDSSYTVINTEIDELFIVYQNVTSFEVFLMKDWNMVGLPLEVHDGYYLTLFPNAIENTLYSWQGYYELEDTLKPGVGYWLRNEIDDTVQINGKAIQSVTIDLIKDWNMIAGPSGDVPLAAVEDPDQVIIENTLYQWDGYYVLSDTIRQGKGYWLRASDSGRITISLANNTNSEYLAKRKVYHIIYSYPTITITDAGGSHRNLYLGLKYKNAEDSLKYTLPPVPPSNCFDVRFDNQCYATGKNEVKILIQTSNYPINVEITGLESKDGYQYVLKANEGNEQFTFKESGEFVFNNKLIESLILTIEKIIPKKFMVYQNYPNPFNPTTEIRYDLPESGKVKIEIYNILGEKIRTLFSGYQEAGIHKIKWDGKNAMGHPMSSGIYFYIVNKGMKRFVKKMILMK
ncbi:Sulphatase-modifying factor protein [Caldithrix abyssi DSM 13497]|uniref:mannan endo-1,4-beta-mannosidase n=1 Tax=Caldithrix abyssi DSM 13497 TaxID=880073 RepID=H1XSV9_CALAY|nr:SUMF1/EgtB/PvdO family nonheme iron enzyme [Caldithrix abyssi]APF20287.1 Por secretion system C-terminal sorting domain-containing protein [Caldithrix abyssi DSM 13497]EHO40336.1 Sulphatase-modifying factor protein [Caldithrix abyssi DSM 13497]